MLVSSQTTSICAIRCADYVNRRMISQTALFVAHQRTSGSALCVVLLDVEGTVVVIFLERCEDWIYLWVCFVGAFSSSMLFFLRLTGIKRDILLGIGKTHSIATHLI